MPILHKIFKKKRRRRGENISFYEASLGLISKPDRAIPKKERKLQNIFSYIYRHKNLEQNTRKQNPAIYEKIIYCDQLGLISKNQLM